MTDIFEGVDVISMYTRKQAIEDGFQVQLTEVHAKLAIEAGYLYPVFLTTGVFSLIEKACSKPKHFNDFTGVLWDILWMSRAYSKPLNDFTSSFEVIITGTGRKRIHKMLIKCGATDFDNPAPAFTIMLPDED